MIKKKSPEAVIFASLAYLTNFKLKFHYWIYPSLGLKKQSWEWGEIWSVAAPIAGCLPRLGHSAGSPKKKVGEFSFLQEREGERCKASVDFPFTLRIIGWILIKKPTIGNGLFPPTKVILPNKKKHQILHSLLEIICLEGILEVIGGIFNTLKSKKMAILSMPNDTSKLLFWQTYLCVCHFVCLINTRNNPPITTKVILDISGHSNLKKNNQAENFCFL